MKYIFVLALILTATPLRAQVEPDTVGSLEGIEIATSVDLAEMYIGDLVTYKVTITYDSAYSLIPPPLGANLGAFEVKDYAPDEEETLNDGRRRTRTSFVLSTYTTGDYVIPPLPVTFLLPDSSHKVLLAEPVPIRVLSMLDQAGSDSLEIVDILPLAQQYEFPPDYSAYYFWGGIILAVLALITAILVWVRRKPAEVIEDLRSPWEIAFEKLAFLNESFLVNDSLAADGRHKEYYLEVTEVTRDYLGRIYEVDVLEMTTEQFVEAFEDVDLPNDSFDRLTEFYGHADMVKFARFRPTTERARQDFDLAHDVIDKVRVDYERRQQMDLRVRDESGKVIPEADEAKTPTEEQVS
ncbi:MAG: protein BatD [bacterium]|nr:protein BatD [bacterium]